MALPQQKFREIVFQLLYSYDISKNIADDISTLIMKELAVTKKTVHTAQERVEKILERQTEIDTLIAQASISYRFERIQTIERNVLRLGIFEMMFDDGIPPKVAISEAIRLARKFGTRESASFVNAILDNLYKASRGEQMDAEQIEKAAADLAQQEKIASEAELHRREKQDDVNTNS